MKKEKPERRMFMLTENVKLKSSTIFKGVILRSDAFIFGDGTLSIKDSYTFKDIPLSILEEVTPKPKEKKQHGRPVKAAVKTRKKTPSENARISDQKI